MEDKAILDLVREWKEHRSITILEMLKSAMRPLVEEQVLRNWEGLRQEDVRKEAEELVIEALESYEPDRGMPLTDAVWLNLKHLPSRLEHIRNSVQSLRSRPAP